MHSPRFQTQFQFPSSFLKNLIELTEQNDKLENHFVKKIEIPKLDWLTFYHHKSDSEIIEKNRIKPGCNFGTQFGLNAVNVTWGFL